MTTTVIDPRARRAPLGGVSPTLAGIELRRILRNRRTMIFTLIFPVVMFLFISAQIKGADDSMGPTVIANVGAYVMVSMALYGAVMATTSAGASVSVERASGWSRQLRLTPLRPTAYVLLKVVLALVVGALATSVTFAVGELTGSAHLGAGSALLSAALIILGSLVFAAFGLFMGYLLPSENAMQFLGPVLAVLSIFGGIFSAPIDPSSTYGQIASLTPIYGLSQVAHWPLTLTTSGTHDPFDISWVINMVAWGAIFVAGAVWRFRKDTARV
ncbi:ABC transporter permease [Nostocoides vanveenii]|uniref:ABC transporter permease n=1 Tax=Nostocoides vanveenii TaxID=330835 RepID=A0ABN2KGN8_9MICO